MVLSSWLRPTVTARVHQVHLTNVGPRQAAAWPTDLGWSPPVWLLWPTSTIAIYYYSVRKLIWLQRNGSVIYRKVKEMWILNIKLEAVYSRCPTTFRGLRQNLSANRQNKRPGFLKCNSSTVDSGDCAVWSGWKWSGKAASDVKCNEHGRTQTESERTQRNWSPHISCRQSIYANLLAFRARANSPENWLPKRASPARTLRKPDPYSLPRGTYTVVCRRFIASMKPRLSILPLSTTEVNTQDSVKNWTNLEFGRRFGSQIN